jgi:hypothetical protein
MPHSLRYWWRREIINHNNNNDIELKRLVSLFSPRGSEFNLRSFCGVSVVHKLKQLFSSNSLSRSISHCTNTTFLPWDNLQFIVHVPRNPVSPRLKTKGECCAYSRRVYSEAYSDRWRFSEDYCLLKWRSVVWQKLANIWENMLPPSSWQKN